MGLSSGLVAASTFPPTEIVLGRISRKVSSRIFCHIPRQIAVAETPMPITGGRTQARRVSDVFGVVLRFQQQNHGCQCVGASQGRRLITVAPAVRVRENTIIYRIRNGNCRAGRSGGITWALVNTGALHERVNLARPPLCTIVADGIFLIGILGVLGECKAQLLEVALTRCLACVFSNLLEDGKKYCRKNGDNDEQFDQCEA